MATLSELTVQVLSARLAHANEIGDLADSSF